MWSKNSLYETQKLIGWTETMSYELGPSVKVWKSLCKIGTFKMNVKKYIECKGQK